MKLNALILTAGLLASHIACATQRTAEFRVANMTCSSCPHIVKSSLTRVPGVTAVEVSFKDALAVVRYDDEITDPEKIAQALTANGYPTRAIEAPELHR